MELCWFPRKSRTENTHVLCVHVYSGAVSFVLCVLRTCTREAAVQLGTVLTQMLLLGRREWRSARDPEGGVR